MLTFKVLSVKYHAPDTDTLHYTTPSYIILTLGRPVLALPKQGAAITILTTGMSQTGIEHVTSSSTEWTLYRATRAGKWKIV